MFKDTVRTNRNMCTISDLIEYVACCPTFGFNAFKMLLTLPQGALQPFLHIEVKIMENKLPSCLRTQ